MARWRRTTGVLCLAALLLAAGLTVPTASRADEITVSVDRLRTGWDAAEPGLSPTAVEAGDFGQLFSATVDGAIYGQPLVVGDVVVVTTEQASTYAFDKVSGALRWSRHYGAPFEATSIGCADLTPDLGSTSTPVYDSANGLIYQTTKLADGTDLMHPHWYLQAVSATTGREAAGYPVVIAGTPDNTPGLPFDPFFQMQRPGLLLLGGVVYIGFGAHCDIEPYRGYVVGVSTTSHSITTMWSDESGAGADANSQAGIWQAGGGLVSDGPGRIFLSTGNGISPPAGPGDSPPGTLAESVVRLQVGRDGRLTPASFFAPGDAPTLDQYDEDLGSGGPAALPDEQFGTAAHPHLLVEVGKDGRVFLLDRDHLGGREQGPDGADAALGVSGPFYGVWGHPAVYGGEGGYVYTVENQGNLRALAYGVDADGTPALNSVGTSVGTFGYTSGSPVVTSDGTTPGSALVWVVYSTGPTGSGGQLRAYQAVPSGGLLPLDWSGPIGTASKFAVPATDDGRVYVGTRDGHLLAFGRPAAPALATPPAEFGKVAVGGAKRLTVTVTASRDVSVQSATADGGFTASSPRLPVLLHAGDTMTVPVRFAPTAAGDVSGTLTFVTDAGDYGSILHGYGLHAGVAATPAALDFGQVVVGNGAETLSVSISNTGRKKTTVTGLDLPAAPFSVGSAPTTGTVLKPQQSVTIPVAYDPPTEESDADALVLHSTSGSVRVPLVGTAVQGHSVLTLGQATTPFGDVPVGASSTLTFDISNTGNVPLTVTKAKAPVGAITTDTPLPEGITLAPGAVVHQRVTFAPTTATASRAGYEVTSTDGRGVQTETLTGRGVTKLPAVTTWALNGSAAVLGHGVRLTDTGGNEAGTAVYPLAVPTEGLVASFTAELGDGSAGDGMTFALLDPAEESPASVGAAAGALGFGGLAGVAVALDTFENSTDPSSNFVGVSIGVQGQQTGALAYQATNTAVPDLRAGPVQVHVAVSGGRLTVSVAHRQVIAVDVSAALTATAYVAYTAGTGGLTDDHDITASSVRVAG